MSIENEGETLLDALNAGLAAEEGETPTEEETLEGAETPEGEEIPEGEETPEGEEAPEGDEPEGEEDDGDELEGKEEKPEDEEKPPKEKKATDPVNDPLPKGTLESTRERFQHVVGQLKEQTQAREVAEQERDELVSTITDSGMDAQRFNVMLEYARGVNSGTYEGMQASYKIMISELKALATALGEPLPGVDPLAAYPDLVQLVNEKKTTPEIALETAHQRNRQKARETLQAAGGQRQQQTAARQQAETKATADFTTLGKQLSARDGLTEYKRKAQFVVDAFQETIMALPPQLRVNAFKKAYDKVPAASRTAPAAGGKTAPRKVQPLRGNKVPAGGGKKQPKTLLEAMAPAFE